MNAGCARHREQRPDADDVAAHRRRRRAGERDRNQAARLPFEQQQFHGQQHRGERRRERRRHAGRRAGDQQRLALGAGQMEELRDQRSERAAGHDDRPFGAERPARADRDRGRQRLEQRDLRLDAAAVDQDRFDRFGNAVAADALRAVARHHADDQRAERPAPGSPSGPSVCASGVTSAVLNRWKKNRLVKRPISVEQRQRDEAR